MEALKEWAAVVKALENGEQTIILPNKIRFRWINPLYDTTGDPPPPNPQTWC